MIPLASLLCACLSAVIAAPQQAATREPAPSERPAAAPAASSSAAAAARAIANGKLYLDCNAEAVHALDRGELDISKLTSFDRFCENFVTKDDALVRPVKEGTVWYGIWEDAVREAQRSGRPLLVHFGAPRTMAVCGVW
jgi:hypothetical protein